MNQTKLAFHNYLRHSFIIKINVFILVLYIESRQNMNDDWYLGDEIINVSRFKNVHKRITNTRKQSICVWRKTFSMLSYETDDKETKYV